MNAALLLKHYARIADAPDAIARIRRFILDLAVRGKLVEQDAEDEPATDLLERLKKHNAFDGQKRRGKARDTAAGNALEDIPFDTPKGWTFASLGELVRVLNGRAYKQQELLDKGTPVLRVGNLFTSNHWYYSDLDLDDDKHCDAGDLIYAWSASFGPFIWNGPRVIYHYHIWKLPLVSEADLDKRYLYNFLLQKTREIKEAGHGISMVHMTKEKMEKLIVPLPPLAEQHRIVAKVGELMALCDQLETARAEREAARDTFSLSTLAKLNTPDPETFGQDARFALANLAPLTTRPDQIKQLRQTILNLGVRGKLVEQDPSDKPSSDLLKQIATERVRLVKLGELRREKPFEPIEKTELPFDLPKGWSWARLGSLIHLISGQHLQPNEYSETVNDGLPYITGPSDFGSNGLQISRFALVRKAVAKRGQLLLTVKGSGVGKTTTCNIPEVAISRQLMALTAIEWDRQFLVLVTHRLAEALQASARSLIPGISREDVEQFVLGLPPLAEQRRIVAKVDELMAVCDRLEACITTGEQTRSRLLEAVLHKALEPA